VLTATRAATSSIHQTVGKFRSFSVILESSRNVYVW